MYFSQNQALQVLKVDDITEELEDLSEPITTTEKLEDLRDRYTKAGVILGFVALIELFLIMRIAR
jgi:hypothetical protein